MTFELRFWPNRTAPQRHGYTPANVELDEIAMFRIGPLVIGWQLDKDADA